MTTTTGTPLYCLRCKERTPNVAQPESVTAKNGRPMLRAECTECGGNKSQFTSTPK